MKIKIYDYIKHVLTVSKVSRRIQVGIIIGAVLVGGAAVAGIKVASQSNVPEMVKSEVVDQEINDSGEVAGVSTDSVTATPSATPTSAKKATSLRPTATPAPTSTSQQNSNNNNATQQNNNSSNQAQSNPTSQASSPTPIPTDLCSNLEGIQTEVPAGYEYQPSSGSEPSICLPIPTPTPTPDNTPFEASWNVSWNGNQVSATVTANKPLKRCLYDIWGGSMSLSGDSGASGNNCTIGPAGSPGSSKIWVRAEAMTGETKDFGDPNPPSQGNVNL